MGKNLHMKITVEVFGDEYVRNERLYANSEMSTILALEEKLIALDVALTTEQKKKLGIR